MMWIVLLLLLAGSAAASASETALFALSGLTLEQFRTSGSVLLRRVAAMMRDPRRVLVAVLIANTGVNVAIYAVSFQALKGLEDVSPSLAALGSVAVVLGVIVFGEILPKALALSAPRTISPFAALIIGGIQIVIAPVQWVLSTLVIGPLTRLLTTRAAPAAVTTEELRLLVDQSARHGVLTSQENLMLQAVVALGDSTVREVMTPRVDIVSIRLGDRRDGARRALHDSRRRKLPVCGKDLDDIRGILHARDLHLRGDAPLETLLRPADFVPEHIRLFQLIRHFRERRIEFAIVVDEYGGTTGLVSMQDVLERIVGNLSEHGAVDGEADVQRLDDDTYVLPGDFNVRDWAQRFGVEDFDERIDTLAGLVVARLGRMPRRGDRVRVRNLTLTVDQVSRHRIDRIVLRREDRGDAPEREPRR